MALAALITGLLGVLVMVAPLFFAVPLGLGPTVALLGGGLCVAGVVLLVPVLSSRQRRERAGRAVLLAALAVTMVGTASSLYVKRALIEREAAVERAARPPATESEQRQRADDDQKFDQEFKENLNK